MHYDPKLPIVVASDASPTGLGAVISHVLPNEEEKPIVFASRTLSPAEQNYSQIEKEALGFIYAVQKFHIYLYGREFLLETDNQPLSFILHPNRAIPAVAASRIQTWAIQLSGYRYKIKCKRSKENALADGLSRLPIKHTQHGEAIGIFNLGEIESFHKAQLNKGPITEKEISLETQKDPILAKVLRGIRIGWGPRHEISPDVLRYFRCKDEHLVEQGCLLRGVRVVVPSKLSYTHFAKALLK